MGSFSPFAIRVSLASPIIIGRRLTLDGLLAALVFERTNDVGEAHERLPLLRRDGVWAGSAALIEGPTVARPSTYIQALRAELEIEPGMIASGRSGRYPRVEAARGDYRNRMTVYREFATPAVWFSGCGDVEAVRDLLADVPFIGTKRSSGRGQVASVDFAPVDNRLSGFAFTDGTPARPVPVDAWKELSNAPADTALETCWPPYWNGERVLCALPRHQVLGGREIRVMLGL